MHLFPQKHYSKTVKELNNWTRKLRLIQVNRIEALRKM